MFYSHFIKIITIYGHYGTLTAMEDPFLSLQGLCCKLFLLKYSSKQTENIVLEVISNSAKMKCLSLLSFIFHINLQ